MSSPVQTSLRISRTSNGQNEILSPLPPEEEKVQEGEKFTRRELTAAVLELEASEEKHRKANLLLADRYNQLATKVNSFVATVHSLEGNQENRIARLQQQVTSMHGRLTSATNSLKISACALVAFCGFSAGSFIYLSLYKN